MKLKSLVLGTAAGALAVTGAQAADLPVAPEPIDYVRVCDAFGPGYYFIPGTDTCLRVAGRIRADYNYFDFDEEFDFPQFAGDVFSNGAPFGAFGTSYRGTNAYRFRARAYIYMDSRTNTEFGILRTFTEVYFTVDAGGGNFRGVNGVYGGSPFFIGDQPADGSPSITLNRAFIQLGGLTFGRTQSFYDFTETFGSAQFFNADYSDTTTNVAAYTAVFGNGFSASISIEDEDFRRLGGFPGSTRQVRTLVDPFGVFGGPFFIDGPVFDTTANYAGNRIPDIVGNLRIDQGWGSAQIMGAGHHVQVAEIPESQYGWAAGAGVAFNVPFGTGTQFGVQGGYTNGALSYVAAGPVGPGVADATIDQFGNLDLVTAWSVSGGFSTSFTPNISFGVQAGYLNVDHDETTDLVINDGFFATTRRTFFDNRDFNNLDVDAFLGYSPVAGLDLGLGVQYKRVMGLEGDQTVIVRNSVLPGDSFTAVFNDPDPDDLDALSVFARVQRTF